MCDKDNPVEKVLKVKREIAKDCGYDISKMVERTKRIEEKEKSRVVKHITIKKVA